MLGFGSLAFKPTTPFPRHPPFPCSSLHPLPTPLATDSPSTHAVPPAHLLMGCCSCQVEYDPTSIRSTVRALQATPSNPDVAIRACDALFSLANGDKKRVPIAKAGGIEAILNAMPSNAGNLEVNESGCWALGSLADNDASQNFGTVAVAVAISFILTIPFILAIPFILKAMTAQTCHAGVCVGLAAGPWGETQGMPSQGMPPTKSPLLRPG